MVTILILPTIEAIYRASTVCRQDNVIAERVIISSRMKIGEKIRKIQQNFPDSSILVFSPFYYTQELGDILKQSILQKAQITWYAKANKSAQSQLDNFHHLTTKALDSRCEIDREVNKYLRFKKNLAFLGNKDGFLATEHLLESINSLSKNPHIVPVKDRDAVSNFAEIDFPAIEGTSPKMTFLKKEVHRVADSGLSKVLLLGETGTGKEAVAFFIHCLDPLRKNNKFGIVNCAILQEEFLISELFGHEKGSFTGAVQKKTGLVSKLDGGTLFLDELPELSPGIQAMLLRFLESGTYTSLGSTHQKRADIKIISAAQKSLIREKLETKNFRQDLYYRLAGKTIYLPGLREIPEDIPDLIVHLAYKIEHDSQKRDKAVQYFFDRIEELKSHTWPGNVRELANYVTRRIKLGEDEHIDLQEFNFFSPNPFVQQQIEPEPFSEDLRIISFNRVQENLSLEKYRFDTLDDVKRKYTNHVYSTLSRRGVPKTEISAILEVSVNTLKKLIRSKEC